MKKRVIFGETVLEYVLKKGARNHVLTVSKTENGEKETAYAKVFCGEAEAEQLFEKLWRGTVTPISLGDIVEELDAESVM